MVLMAKELPVIWQENSGGNWWKRDEQIAPDIHL
jgi:hypothetical protein